MRPFGYLAAPDPAAAVAAVAGRPGAAFLAGGTNLVDLMKLGVAEPGLLVEVAGLLPGLSGPSKFTVPVPLNEPLPETLPKNTVKPFALVRISPSLTTAS